MSQPASGYEFCLSVDFRCFDNMQADFGVQRYLDLLGFIPHKLLNHETYMDQIHTHEGVIDDAKLEPHWTSQRAMPGAQVWTKRQYKGLIDELHRRGIKIYHGAEAAWSIWPEYGERSRAKWIYENLPEVFVIYDNGVSSTAGMGAINPLRRFSDGTYYEDRICRDVTRFLLDYELDGFFAADGFAGHHCQLKHGDYAPDIIAQFTEHSGIVVPAGPVSDRSDFIWEKHRYAWILFYSDRWAAFHGKLSGAVKGIGKDLISFTPFQLGPCDSLMEYGFDYGKSHRAGLTTLCLEAMEEVTGRRFQGPQGWEAICISNVATVKALAPDVTILWTSSTCNCPEHWHTLRDQPNILEREILALGSTTYIDNAGQRKRAFDGYLAIFGIDLKATEWRWLKERLDLGFGFDVESNLGPAVLWSDHVLYEHARRGTGWPISATVAKLRFAGIPIQSAVTIANVPRATQGSYLLVDPIGIADDEVAILEQAVASGALLIVVGDLENLRLLELLGIARAEESAASKKWRVSSRANGLGIITDSLPQDHGWNEADLQGYQVTEATCVAEVLSDEGTILGTAVAVHSHGAGKCLFIRRAHHAMPSLAIEMTAEEKRGTPRVHGKQDPGMTSTREVLESMAKLHPDALDLFAARALHAVDPSLPRCDKGQLLGFRDTKGDDYLLVENAANLMYYTVHVDLPKVKTGLSEFAIKPIGPVGYLFYDDPNDQSFDVCVPPDAGIPLKIKYKTLD